MTALKFPRHTPRHGDDWVIDPAFLQRVLHSIEPGNPYEFTPTQEQVEVTLLALEVIPNNLYTTPPAPAQQEPESECNPQDLCAGCRCKYAEQPAQQEPVSQWQKRHPHHWEGKWENTNEHDAKWWRDNSQGWEIRALYTAPQPPAQPLMDEQIEREWQFLHDEEGNPPDHHDFARAIEAAHGITKGGAA